MRRLHEWFIYRKEQLTFLGALILSLVLIFTNDRTQIQTVRAWTLDGIGFLLEDLSVLKQMISLHKENSWLRQKNAELMLENSRLREALLENQRLRQMLAFKSESQLDLIPAKVIGKGSNGFINSVLIAMGHADGLKKNMAVVTAQGLVGKIFHVGRHRSTAQLLLDRNFRVSAMVQRSRVTGIIKWHEGNEVILAEVPKRSDVLVGDIVVTSGFSTIFPGGLRIGYVSRIIENVDGMFMHVLVRPGVEFSKLEEVFVIRSHDSQPTEQ